MSYASTVNPVLPVTFSPLMSAVIRSNFAATANDINNIYSLLGGGAVLSVFGRTGNVAASSGDYTIAQITGAGALASLGVGTGLSSDGSNLNITANQRTRSINFQASGGSFSVVSNTRMAWTAPYAGKITAWALLADQNTASVVDIWKVPFVSYPPNAGNSITGGAPPTIIAGSQSGTSASLGAWTQNFNAGDTFIFNVNSNTAAVTLSLTLTVLLSA